MITKALEGQLSVVVDLASLTNAPWRSIGTCPRRLDRDAHNAFAMMRH